MAVRRQDLRDLRAAKILDRKIHGVTNKEIAREFRMAEDTVQRELIYAKKRGLIKKAEEDVLTRLVPEAVNVYAGALAEKDVFVAKHVLELLSKLGERDDRKQIAAQEMNLEVYLSMRKEKSKERDDDETDNQSTITAVVEAVPETNGAPTRELPRTTGDAVGKDVLPADQKSTAIVEGRYLDAGYRDVRKVEEDD